MSLENPVSPSKEWNGLEGADLEVGYGSQTAGSEVLNQAKAPSRAASRAWGHAAHIPEASFSPSESCPSPGEKGQSLGNRFGKALTPGLGH